MSDNNEQNIRFEGFRTGSKAVAIPVEFFNELMPTLNRGVEIRVVLHVIYMIFRKSGRIRAVSFEELVNETSLRAALSEDTYRFQIKGALDRGVQAGALLECHLNQHDFLYFLNNEGGRRQYQQIQMGTLSFSKDSQITTSINLNKTTPIIAYEQEIGTVTPAIAEAIREAEGLYPTEWIIEALNLASTNNARSWRYVDAILKRWNKEGRNDETNWRNNESTDPYSHLYRRQ
ncbi:MAG: DnaD domain-containing protein [Dehalococcoidia bacterium]